MKKLIVFAVSDSSGETAMQVAKTACSQFKNIEIEYERYPFITTDSILNGILNLAEKKKAIIFHTLVDTKLSNRVVEFTKTKGLRNFDCIQKPLQLISDQTDEHPEKITGLVHDLNENYFDRIAAMEFAVANDDGKNPQNLAQADIVILGVSRTSKTPLSLYLANKNLKVANVPIGPETQLPDEIWSINKNKIFGLTNSVEALKKIREARMLSYGLDVDTPYSNTQHIEAELAYARKLYNKIGCLNINVYDKSIEETATIIMESLNIDTREK
ncbi:pyruvate, water dikinase regulatory protein [Apilactobacillus xinyiensis]|uniref:Putative pyruvate, phosphate dikinase regulatory protein n=1 Tax=Apilactobacillus xinyiensis TaxID=2841032 RepID=A0ABT0I136_9LACO|nr:pyruvate, water dikinase regulatory protein [Apilactobacillus xinyiensis]MCK8624057.1 kinase/pyrophosphorylase [Apilactobacillus xinyiensis]MCL0318206.1 kinase/pyrophosphorylase [Apilactobacillus xinyiensis]